MLTLSLFRFFNWLLDGLMNFITYPVTELPFGMDEALNYFATVIGQILHVMPWMEVVWQVFLIAMGVKVTLWLIEMMLFMYKLVRG